jgi:hypothetical protein
MAPLVTTTRGTIPGYSKPEQPVPSPRGRDTQTAANTAGQNLLEEITPITPLRPSAAMVRSKLFAAWQSSMSMQRMRGFHCLPHLRKQRRWSIARWCLRQTRRSCYTYHCMLDHGQRFQEEREVWASPFPGRKWADGAVARVFRPFLATTRRREAHRSTPRQRRTPLNCLAARSLIEAIPLNFLASKLPHAVR